MRRVGTVVIGGLGGLSGLALLIASIVGLRIAIEVLMDLSTHSRGINWPVAAGIFAADVVVFCVALLTLRWAFKVLWPAKMTPVYASVAETPEVQEAFRREVRALLTEVGVISLDAEGSVFPVGVISGKALRQGFDVLKPDTLDVLGFRGEHKQVMNALVRILEMAERLIGTPQNISIIIAVLHPAKPTTLAVANAFDDVVAVLLDSIVTA